MIRTANQQDLQQIVPMAQVLYEEADASILQSEFQELVDSRKDLVLVAERNHQTVGFLHMAMRYEYVEGMTGSPVAYLEGIYVKSDFRKKGVAVSMVREAELWGTKNGATAFASDALLDNAASIAFHQRIGYEIISRNVHFLKPVKKERRE